MNHPWTDSWAFWAGILAWMFGALYLVWAWINRRSGGGGQGLGSLAPRPHVGPTRAIVPLSSPASGHECVYYKERDETDELASRPNDFADEQRALQTREDLRALRCYWGPGTFVTEGVPGEADETAAPWMDFLAAGVCMLFGSVLLYLSYTRFL